MRNLVWLVTAALIATGGYLLFTGKTVTEVVNDIVNLGETPDVPLAETPAQPAQDSADDATDALESAIDEARDAAEEIADEANEALDATVDQVTQAAEEAATQVEQTVSGINDQLLTVDGFDLEQVRGLIENSELGQAQQAMLLAALEAGQGAPDLLEAALSQVRSAFGLGAE
ncbi:MAG: hypothetical protein AAF755_09720 [Pseudomonadota bacterium]